jgi:hypothetical protein
VHSLARTYDGLIASDEMVIKVLRISEVAAMARIETRLREYLEAEWQRRAKQATAVAVDMARQLKASGQIDKAVGKIMATWQEAITPRYLAEIERIYRLARTAGHKKATRQFKGSLQYNASQIESAVTKAAPSAQLLPSFDLIDQQAVAALKDHQVFWIGEHYKGVSPEIAKITRTTMLEAGKAPSVAGKLMAERINTAFTHVKIPSGFTGTSKQYFDGLVANAATTARVYGQLRSFAEIGITHYKIHATGGPGMCGSCALMDGKVFTVQQGLSQMQSELNATTPDGVKAAAPWISLKELQRISPQPGPLKGEAGIRDAKALSEGGQALPPYHLNCRCTVDVEESFASYEDLSPLPISVMPNTIRMESSEKWAVSLTRMQRDAIASWQANDYAIMRKIDAGLLSAKELQSHRPIIERLETIRESFVSAPVYQGTIYRGLANISEEAFKNGFKAGNTMQLKALESWSKKEVIARKFAYRPQHEKKVFVIKELHVRGGAFDISHTTPNFMAEGEVIVEKNKRMVVKSVKEMSVSVEYGPFNRQTIKGYHVVLEEVE